LDKELEMPIGLLTLHMRIPGCQSLKEKRSLIKPMLLRVHREFNVSSAEMDFLDHHDETVIGFALISNDHTYTRRALQKTAEFIQNNWPDIEVLENPIEIL
jgi:uncharacterized protein